MSLMTAHCSAMLDHPAVGFDQHATEATAAGQGDYTHEVTGQLSLLAAHFVLTVVCFFGLGWCEEF